MKWLLPYRFKSIGAILAPAGFLLWLMMQLRLVSQLLYSFFGSDISLDHVRLVNTSIAIISFFTFLIGVYMMAFSKEKLEDEMVQRTRLDCFQFAALVQIIAIISGFVLMIFFKEPDKEGMMLYFISMICLFWLSFIGRFNYILHVKYRV